MITEDSIKITERDSGNYLEYYATIAVSAKGEINKMHSYTQTKAQNDRERKELVAELKTMLMEKLYGKVHP